MSGDEEKNKEIKDPSIHVDGPCMHPWIHLWQLKGSLQLSLNYSTVRVRARALTAFAGASAGERYASLTLGLLCSSTPSEDLWKTFPKKAGRPWSRWRPRGRRGESRRGCRTCPLSPRSKRDNTPPAWTSCGNGSGTPCGSWKRSGD